MEIKLKDKARSVSCGDVIVTDFMGCYMVCKNDSYYTLVNLENGILDDHFQTLDELMEYALAKGDVVIKNDKLELVERD